METNTGKLLELSKEENEKMMKKLMGDHPLDEVPDMVPVVESDMTLKQKVNMQVSKHDNRSKLGKVFTGFRQNRNTRRRIAHGR
jgi:hypothetical protein